VVLTGTHLTVSVSLLPVDFPSSWLTVTARSSSLQRCQSPSANGPTLCDFLAIISDCHGKQWAVPSQLAATLHPEIWWWTRNRKDYAPLWCFGSK
jgi:hypothetical protein